jgi:isopentenyl phosphate kinase
VLELRKIRILKVGGSVITDKDEGAFEKLNRDALKEVCRAISESWDGLIVVHGAGSFGHPHVKKYGLNTLGASKVHLACLRLSEHFCSTLVEFGVAALPIHPMTFYTRTSDLECNVEYITRALNSGFLPVLHGDVIFGKDGIEVLSGDDIVIHLAECIKPSRIGFATDVDGVLLKGKVVERLDIETVERIGYEGREKTDVTGGMLNKIRKVFSMNHRCEVFIFRGDYGNLKRFLKGEKVGTEVVL